MKMTAVNLKKSFIDAAWLTVDLPVDTAALLKFMVLNCYYEMLRGEISMICLLSIPL